jgi:hypothetical protein
MGKDLSTGAKLVVPAYRKGQLLTEKSESEKMDSLEVEFPNREYGRKKLTIRL